MLRALPFALLFLYVSFAWGMSREAEEFMAVTKQLEPVQCEKRRLRREITLAEVERRDADARRMKQRFSELDRDPKIAKLEKRLSQLEPRVAKSGDPEDLRAIDRQRVEAFYRCD